MPEPLDDNPFAAPPAGAADSTFFKTVATKVTFRELWWNTRPNLLTFAIGSLFKILHVPLPAPFGFAPESLALVDPSELPPGPRDALSGVLQQCAKLGFTPRFAELLPCVGDAEGYAVILSNREGTMLASANCARYIRRIEVHVSFASLLNNGRRLTITNAPRRLLTPPGVDARYHAGASVEDLLRAHRLRLLEIGDGWPVALNDAGLRQYVRDIEQQSLEFQEGRGVWARMTVAEVDRVRATAQR